MKLLKDQLFMVKASPVTAIGAIANGWSEKDAEYWFEAMGKFAGYGFNRSHSAAYADLAYQTAYLKAHYPVEFMAAQLTTQAGDKDKTLKNLGECRRMGVKILPPDINQSRSEYKVEEYEDDAGNKHLGIRFGLLSIDGIGTSTIEAIENARIDYDQNGNQIVAQFKTFDEFISRASGRNVNKNHIEKLIQVGAFDETEPNRYRLLNHYFFNIRKEKQYAGSPEDYFKAKKHKDKTKRPKDVYPVHDPSKYTEDKGLAWEKELMGTFLSGHPLDDLPYQPWHSYSDGEQVKLGGRIVSVRQHKVKGSGKLMCFFKLETQAETIDCTVFPKDYPDLEERIFKDNIVIIKGKKQVNNRGENVIIDNVMLSRKKKHKVVNPKASTIPDIAAVEHKKQREFFNEEDLPTLTPKEDPLAALFRE